MTGYLTKLKEEMEERLGCGIEVVEDRDLGCSCKFEFARNYARKHHVLRVNPARCVNDYPVFYNLLNVKLQLQALDDGSLGVVQPVSNAQESDRFNADFSARRASTRTRSTRSRPCRTVPTWSASKSWPTTTSPGRRPSPTR